MNASAVASELQTATLAAPPYHVGAQPAAGLLQMATTFVSLHLSATSQKQQQQQSAQLQQQQQQQSAAKRRAEISLREVSEHDCLGDCWLVIYDRVYDVTEFLATHPGGADVMLEYAGRDASLAFRSCGHSRAAIELLAAYEIGELPVAERIFRCAGKLEMGDLPL